MLIVAICDGLQGTNELGFAGSVILLNIMPLLVIGLLITSCLDTIFVKINLLDKAEPTEDDILSHLNYIEYDELD